MNKHQDYSEVQVNKRNYLIIPCKLGVFFDYVSKFLHLFLSQIAQEMEYGIFCHTMIFRGEDLRETVDAGSRC
jgi:hypothetical protein